MLIDLTPKFAQITVTSPVFKETAENGGETLIQLSDPLDPLRQLSFYIPDLTFEESASVVDISVVNDSDPDLMVIRFDKKEANLLDTFDVVFCYSYGDDWANLSELCDETVLHPVTNALGTCFTEFFIQLEAASVNVL